MILEFINDNPNLITALATVALVCVTIYYAWDNHKMRVHAQTPHITINPYCFDCEGIHVVYLLIENIGLGTAYDVQFETDLSFRLNAVLSLGDLYIFRKGINHLKSGGQKYCVLDKQGFKKAADKSPLNIHVTYKDWRQREYSDCLSIDFNEAGEMSDAIKR